MKLVIDRTQWLHGEGSQQSYLVRTEDKKMCCLGFLGLSCGYTKDELEDKQVPEQICDNSKWPILFHNEDEVAEFTTTNDRTNITDEEREQELIKLFRAAGIEVTFIN